MKRLAKLSALLFAAVLVFGSRAQATSSLQVIVSVTIDGYNSIAWEDGTTDPINLALHNPDPGSQKQYDCWSNGGLKRVMNTSQHGTAEWITVSIGAIGINLADPGVQPMFPNQWGADSSLRRNGPVELGPGGSRDWDCTIFAPNQVTQNQTGSITFTLTATAQ